MAKKKTLTTLHQAFLGFVFLVGFIADIGGCRSTIFPDQSNLDQSIEINTTVKDAMSDIQLSLDGIQVSLAEANKQREKYEKIALTVKKYSDNIFEIGSAEFLLNNYVEASELWELAADQGNGNAQVNIGVLYSWGIGRPKSFKKSFKYAKLAADQGHMAGQSNLGYLYHNGKGTTKNNSLALKYYRLAADQGLMVAQFNIGLISTNNKEKIKYYIMAAAQGHADAQHNLGRMYLLGEGVFKNNQKAIEYLKMASDQGVMEAQNNLGTLYVETGNYNLSFKYYKLSADFGDRQAQYNVGAVYANGWGVEKDTKKAIDYMIKSARQGFQPAQEVLRELNLTW